MFRAPEPMTALPFKKLTVPVGVPLAEDTVAVRMTGTPRYGAAFEVARTVAVEARPMVTEPDAGERLAT